MNDKDPRYDNGRKTLFQLSKKEKFFFIISFCRAAKNNKKLFSASLKYSIYTAEFTSKAYLSILNSWCSQELMERREEMS